MIRLRPQRRSGVLTVCVLVCLMVAATVMAITVHCAIRARRHTQLEHQMIQTEWLLDAGVRRANTKIADQAGYEGETWNPAGALDRFGTATVQIQINRDSTDTSRVEVSATIVASSPGGRTTRKSHQFDLSTNPPDTSTAE